MQTQITRQAAFKPFVAGSKLNRTQRLRVVSVQVQLVTQGEIVAGSVLRCSATAYLPRSLQQRRLTHCTCAIVLFTGNADWREPEGQR